MRFHLAPPSQKDFSEYHIDMQDSYKFHLQQFAPFEEIPIYKWAEEVKS